MADKSRRETFSPPCAGAAFGLCLYAVNMYGFTAVFPWFEGTRDGITVATHAAFGMVAAGVYRMLWWRRLARACPAKGDL